MSMEGAIAEMKRIQDEPLRLRALLEEARSWLCPHDSEAIRMVKEHGMRGWCCFCQNYLRNPLDATLIARIDAELSPMQTQSEEKK